ncbi:N-acetyl sugar amidotransferase [Aurantimicrobium minutum]|uniref:N-acetyl sugar amidotransferase n=1 Tax=Aurantimicrobium minutum TaxID=708131 RepID=UPI0024756E6E|nr:N-acetyl sugar amidotransferase [Aurantimicrobium minutum]MDH6256029.1 N-acetyl sugar amidotransferase [Aurantimicrobium minutum]
MPNHSNTTECSFCVMDTSATGICFDSQGRCNFCLDLELNIQTNLLDSNKIQPTLQDLLNFAEEVKKAGKGKQYDCIVGVSGGLDSSWALIKAKELGLRPLAVHMDNGWNSELAANNIYNLVSKLDVDLFTYVVNWAEYRDLMLAFFKADVIDVELLYDNAMLAVCYQQARKYGIRYILSGSNTATEGLAIPSGWNWRDKRDARNIYSIAKSSGVKIRSLPTISNLRLMIDKYVNHIDWVPFLDYMDYRKEESLETLVSEFDYKPYPYKHYENVFTRFYQAFILPKKFGVDKRRVHFSSLIVSGQLTKKEAQKLLLESTYPSQDEQQADLEYFLKKMEWSQIDLDAYLARPERSHDEWGTDLTMKYVVPAVSPIASVARKLKRN